MTIGASLNAAYNVDAVPVCPVSVASQWTTVIDAKGSGADAGPEAADAATVTNPTTQVTLSTRHILRRLARAGTTLRLRVRYDAGLTGVTSPVVKVFGRVGTQPWGIVRNKSGNISATLTMDTTNDASDATLKSSTPDNSDASWDCDGYDELLVAVETALAGTGTKTNSLIEAKLI